MSSPLADAAIRYSILPAVEQEIGRVVRDALAKDPLIRVAGLKAVLENRFNRGFSHQYVPKIADKVAPRGLDRRRPRADRGAHPVHAGELPHDAGVFAPGRLLDERLARPA